MNTDEGEDDDDYWQQYPVDLYSKEWYNTADTKTFNEETEARYEWLHSLPQESYKIFTLFTIIFTYEDDALLYKLKFE